MSNLDSTQAARASSSALVVEKNPQELRLRRVSLGKCHQISVADRVEARRVPIRKLQHSPTSKHRVYIYPQPAFSGTCIHFRCVQRLDCNRLQKLRARWDNHLAAVNRLGLTTTIGRATKCISFCMRAASTHQRELRHNIVFGNVLDVQRV